MPRLRADCQADAELTGAPGGNSLFRIPARCQPWALATGRGLSVSEKAGRPPSWPSAAEAVARLNATRMNRRVISQVSQNPRKRDWPCREDHTVPRYRSPLFCAGSKTRTYKGVSRNPASVVFFPSVRLMAFVTRSHHSVSKFHAAPWRPTHSVSRPDHQGTQFRPSASGDSVQADDVPAGRSCFSPQHLWSDHQKRT